MRFLLALVPLALSCQPASTTITLATDTGGEAAWQIHFSPRLGDRVRILKVYGDFVSRPTGSTARGTFATSLFSLHTALPDQPSKSSVTPYVADTCFLSVYGMTSGKPRRSHFSEDITGALLGEANDLFVVLSVSSNTTGVPIQLEAKWVTVFEVEDKSGNVLPPYASITSVQQLSSVPISRRP